MLLVTTSRGIAPELYPLKFCTHKKNLKHHSTLFYCLQSLQSAPLLVWAMAMSLWWSPAREDLTVYKVGCKSAPCTILVFWEKWMWLSPAREGFQKKILTRWCPPSPAWAGPGRCCRCGTPWQSSCSLKQVEIIRNIFMEIDKRLLDEYHSIHPSICFRYKLKSFMLVTKCYRQTDGQLEHSD